MGQLVAVHHLLSAVTLSTPLLTFHRCLQLIHQAVTCLLNKPLVVVSVTSKLLVCLCLVMLQVTTSFTNVFVCRHLLETENPVFNSHNVHSSVHKELYAGMASADVVESSLSVGGMTLLTVSVSTKKNAKNHKTTTVHQMVHALRRQVDLTASVIKDLLVMVLAVFQQELLKLRHIPTWLPLSIAM